MIPGVSRSTGILPVSRTAILAVLAAGPTGETPMLLF